MNTPVYHFTSISALRRHPEFEAAKSGCISAARHVVRAFVRTFVQEEDIQSSKNIALCPVTAVEKTGVNLLPLVLAQYIGKVAKYRVETEIVQVNSTHHTDANAVHRLLNRPVFEGPVTEGMSYLLVDDVITTGSTLQGLRLHLERHGARVEGFCVLAGSFNMIMGSSLVINQTCATRTELRAKFGKQTLDEFLQDFGIAESSGDLTNSQARYLLSFKSLDSLRDRISEHRNPCISTNQLELAYA
ncbi:MAG: hypothetical protein A2283_18815 [Lentisphaerae bacterium RIFOXYA12_FULL_48_11]|nr:MAG: hypothetical protein A2283_18815 [Lentisphaerae bacterium RIFOXYA12_FULL_48_11]